MCCAQVAAAAALSALACDNVETQNAIAKAGGIGPILALLASRSHAAQSQGMAALAQLARHNRDNQDSIARMEGINIGAETCVITCHSAAPRSRAARSMFF